MTRRPRHPIATTADTGRRQELHCYPNKKPKHMSKKAQQPNFSKKVYTVVAKIKKGTVMSYGQVAAKAGNPKAARAVGALMANNYDPDIPCHRVVCGDGRIGGYNRGGAPRKLELLMQEGF